MGKEIKIGTVTIEQQLTAIKKGNREAELEQNVGWKSITRMHKSDKTYSRKNKHKNQ